MRTIRIFVFDESEHTLDWKEFVLRDEDADINQIVLSKSRADSQIIRGQIGTLEIGSEVKK